MAAIAVTPQSTQWSIDSSHSDVQFSVRHMGLFTVKGHFGKVTGSATTVDGKLAGFDATIDASSVSTREDARDNHLRSADFFNIEQFPTFEFRSTRVVPAGDNKYKVIGDLTIAGKTNSVELDVETTKAISDPWGNTRSGAHASAQISRKEWGLTWNAVLETGSLMVSDEVKISIDVEAIAA